MADRTNISMFYIDLSNLLPTLYTRPVGNREGKFRFITHQSLPLDALANEVCSREDNRRNGTKNRLRVSVGSSMNGEV